MQSAKLLEGPELATIVLALNGDSERGIRAHPPFGRVKRPLLAPLGRFLGSEFRFTDQDDQRCEGAADEPGG